MPWYHVNGIPILSADKQTAIKKYNLKELISLYKSKCATCGKTTNSAAIRNGNVVCLKCR